MKNRILDRLQSCCPFEPVFQEVEDPEAVPVVYRKKVGHIRADFDGSRWWNTVWRCHKDLETPEICREIDVVYEALTAKDAFADLAALKSYCAAHPEARAEQTSDGEYNFYLVGETCLFWLRCITRERDYNLYLHTFIK